MADQIVVAAATGNRSQFSSAIEDFENGAGVISQTAHNPNIDIDKASESPRAKSIHQSVEFSAPTTFVEDREDWLGQLAKFLPRFLARFAAGFVDRPQNVFPFFGRKFLLPQKISPELPVADANNEILFRQPEGTQDVDAERNQLDVGGEIALAHDVTVELVMFAQPAALLFFVTKELTDGKPLERLFECALVRGNNARQRWRQLWPHRHFAIAFVGEIEKLIDNFRAAFLAVEIGRLEQWAVPFDKTVTARNLAPEREDVVPRRAVVG